MQRTDHLADSAATRFDLLDILHILLKRRKFILLLTGLAFLVGLAAYFLPKPTYEAKAELMVGNPMYSDRSRIFSQGAYVDYFATEQINDRALAIINSEQVAREIIVQNGLLDAYQIKREKPGAMEAAIKRLQGSLKIRRTEFGSLQVTYNDQDPTRAAQVVNSAITIMEGAFHRYLSGLRLNTRDALQRRIAQSDSAIRSLTDSLVALRERTGIYDIISPSRYGIITGSVHTTNARAIEEIQNLSSVKDQYVIDRSRYMGMAAEANTGIDNKELPVLQIITPAEVPGERGGMGLVATLITFTLAGLFFAVLWVVFAGWYQRMTLALRHREDLS